MNFVILMLSFKQKDFYYSENCWQSSLTTLKNVDAMYFVLFHKKHTPADRGQLSQVQ